MPLALLGAAAVVVATGRYGPGLTPDSANYLSAAASLASGQGLLSASGEPMVHFPPLLPGVLAAFEVIGVAGPTAARLLNALCFACVVGATVALVTRVASGTASAVFAGVFVLLSAPLLDAFAYAWSEAPFVALLACFAVLLARPAATEGRRGLPALALVAAGIALTRYIGVVVVPAAALVIAADSPGPARRRVARAGLFSAIAMLPLTAWLLRNLHASGTLTGPRGASATGVASVLRGFVASVVDWIVPWEWLTALRPFSGEPWALLLFLFAAAAVAMWVALHLVHGWRAGTDRAARRIVGFLALWVCFYSSFLCVSAMLVSFNPIEPRFLVPLVFPVAVLVAFAVTTAADNAKRPAGWRRGILVGCIVVILALQAGRAASLLAHMRSEGAGGYATRAWQESPLLAFLVENPPSRQVLTNGADVLFLATGERRSWVPRAGDSSAIEAVAAALDRGERIEIVWFGSIDWRPYLISRGALLGLGDFELVYEDAGGAMYSSRVRGPVR